MLRFGFLLVLCSLLLSCNDATKPLAAGQSTILGPDERFPELFKDVQMARVFADGKTFADATALQSDKVINEAYKSSKQLENFSLKGFCEKYFIIPGTVTEGFVSDTGRLVQDHIRALWPVLTRMPDSVREGSTLLPLKKPYVVPGGRFREIYYWDSYFTMLGLVQDGRTDLVKSMIDNFADLILTHGHIPNGNRAYYSSRSQPPFFAAMVKLLADKQGDSILVKYLKPLELEYAFWMADSGLVKMPGMSSARVVRMPDGGLLNRYYDNKATPRAESYREDVELQIASGRPGESIWRDVRAAAESGWDFSSRWLKDGKTLSTIRTTSIVPVDLNSLIYNLELTLAWAYRASDRDADALRMEAVAAKRVISMNRYFWDPQFGFFMDYDFQDGVGTGIRSMAGAYPLYFGWASKPQAERVAVILAQDFLFPGGFVSTPYNTGQQWDAPNGWAPLQWIGIKGLQRYQINDLAAKATVNWCMLNAKVYRATGKMMEKYDVTDLKLEAGGGEYPVQDGFGWSNGVLQALIPQIMPKG
jgi:alpha,alpha-trehalase